MRELINKLNYYTKLYDEGNPIIADKEWDTLYFKLKKLEEETGIIYSDSPTQTINYELKSELKKVKHNHLMLSADKTKDWNEFLRYFSNHDVIGMLKLDGLTCSLRYLNGQLVSAETRGDGETGEDITHNAKVIKSIPKNISYKEELILDGEVICTNKDFKLFSKIYKNPRNFASGSIRLLDSKECEKRNLTFVVWNVVKGFENSNSFMDKLQIIEKLGFLITPWTSSFDWDAKEFLINQANEYGYPIDGLVGRFDDIQYGENLGATGHHTKAIYAFKFYDETAETRLKTIEWSMSRNGTLTPIAVFDPVELEGTTVSRANLHNVSIMENIMGDCCYLGQILTIHKANEIIPEVVSAIKMNYGDVIAHGGVTVDHFSDEYFRCPVCGGSTSIIVSDSGTKIMVCDNPQCQGKLVQRIDHFCSKKGMNIKGLSLATLNKLIDWKWINNIKDIYSLKNYKDKWINKSGFGGKSVQNILDAIEENKYCELYQFISALGIPLIGVTVAKEICKYYDTWEDFKSAIGGDWSNLDGFGPEMEKELNNFDYTEADEIAEMLTFKHNNQSNISNVDAKGLTFCITGKTHIYKNRDALKSYIESIGGKVVSSMSSKVDYLINNNIKSTSSKNKAAISSGIPIITEDEFIASFGQDS